MTIFAARRKALLLSLGLTAGCALKGDVRKVELQVQALKADLAKSDAARAAERDSTLAAIRLLQQAVSTQQAYLVQMRGDLRTELTSVQQQLQAVQELSGLSQQRITELRSRLEARQQQDPASGTPGVPVGPSGNPAGPGPDQMYEVSLQQYRRGSLSTARLGFREFLRVFPTHERAADAMFYIGESFEQAAPDSAAAVYDQLVRTYPNSPRAPSALYKQGLLAEQRGDRATARNFYSRVIAGYPRSPEADLARQNQQRLRP
ncbi:MAG TPA: tetratricopeptide repeat protein [Gemmatimonadales bacterium]|nr:tetratricopeptide repeat protein [Gemmatimonadales bacterium]